MHVHRPGDRIGPYRLLQDLGSGGMGTVFLARVDDVAPGLRIGDRVALKIVHSSLVKDFDAFSRFVQEAELGKQIRHENVVSTVDAGMDVHARGETVYLAMEFVAGQTLAEILAAHGPLADGTCRRIGREIARGLAGVHSVGAVHGDIKPANVLMTPDEVVKIMDLGLAHLHGRILETSTRLRFQGTLLYAAPEQFGGAEAVEARTDLYALGMILFELVSGRHPYPHDDPRVVIRHHVETVPAPLEEVQPGTSPFLARLVAQLLEKAPDDRFRSAREVFQILQRGEESRWWRRRATLSAGVPRVTGLERLGAKRDTLLRGRDHELVMLRRVLEEARLGAGRVVLITGAAGIGRTRLLDGFARMLAIDDDPASVRVAVHHRGSAWADAYRRALHLVGPCEPDAVVAAAARAGDDGSVLIVDDLHAAPPAGRAFFLEVARAAAGRPLLIVAASRHDVDRAFRAEIDALPHGTVVEIDAIDESAIRGILSDLRDGPPCEREVARLLDITGGHPAHVLAAVRGLSEAAITDVVRSIVLPRLRALPDADRDVIDAAAALGGSFTDAQLAELTGTPSGEIARRLTRLARGEHVVRRDGDAWRFLFPAIEAVIREALPDALRDEYARLAADVLAHSGADDSRLASAWLAAGDTARAARHLEPGLALLRGRPHRALELADRALACAGELPATVVQRVRLHRAAALLATERGADAAVEIATLLDSRGAAEPS